MDTHTDKQELKRWIDEIEDPAILDRLQSLRASVQQTASWATLSPSAKAGINEGKKDIKGGRVISNEDFWKEYKHRL